MKAFKLTMMAAMLAFASTAMAQEKVTPITAADLTIANGETAELVVNLNYELEAGADALCGASFSLSLPDGLILAGFDSKADQDAATAKKLKGNCDVEVEGGVWDDDADNGYVSVKQKTDGGLLFVLIDQDDKVPFVKTTGAVLCTIAVKAIAEVIGIGKIYDQALTNVKNVSVGMKDGASIFGDAEFGVNLTTGINEIQNAGNEAPAYNLQGVRVNNAKGLIIRDGKKMIVK